MLAAISAVVALIALLYFQWWRNRKRLSYEILSDVELVSAKKIKDKVEIRYEGQPVNTVQLLVVKLVNDGYQPIKKDEFEKPIRFNFSDVKVLTAEREKFQPENIGTEITYQEHYVEIVPALFNRKDYVQFKVLLDGFSKMEVDARIVGVSISEGPSYFTKRTVLSLVIVLFAVASGVFGNLLITDIPVWLKLGGLLLLATVGALFGVIYGNIQALTRR